jgi:O-antigen/teichoic acid export membrane protein
MHAHERLDRHAEEDLRKVAGGAAIAFFGRTLGRSTHFVAQVFLARLLGGYVFGLYGLAFAVVKVAEVLALVGLNAGGMRFVSIYKDRAPGELRRVLRLAVGIPFVNGVLLALVLTYAAGMLAERAFSDPAVAPAIRLFAWGLPFSAGLSAVSSTLQGFHTAKYTVYARDIVQPVVHLALVLLLAPSSVLGLTGAIIAFIVSHGVGIAVGVVSFHRRAPESASVGESALLPELLRFSAPLLFVSCLNYLLAWTDALMLGMLSTVAAVGTYRAAAQIPPLLAAFLAASNAIYAPIVASVHQTGDLRRLRQIFRATTRWIWYLTTPAFLVLVFSASDVMLIFGPGYVLAGAGVVIVLAIGQIVNCTVGGVGMTLIMTGKQGVEVTNSFALVVLNIGLNWLFIPRYGAVGAAIGSATALALANLGKLVAVRLLYGMHPFSAGLLRYALVAGVAASALAAVHGLVEGMARIATNFVVTALIFGLYVRFGYRPEIGDTIFVGAVRTKLAGLIRRAAGVTRL